MSPCLPLSLKPMTEGGLAEDSQGLRGCELLSSGLSHREHLSGSFPTCETGGTEHPAICLPFTEFSLLVSLVLFIPQDSPTYEHEELLHMEASHPTSCVVGRSPQHLTVFSPSALSTVALTIQEAPLLTAPKALGPWTAPKSTSLLTVAASRYLGPWQSLTTDKEQQTNTSLAGKNQKAAHRPRNRS